MDHNAQNTTIAGILGKCVHPISDWVHEGPEGDREIVCSVCRQRPYTVGFPAYTADLNAMHEAVDWANVNQPAGWDDDHFLLTLCGWTGGHPHRATAAQWAEAFLRTLGKWKP